MEVHAEDLSRRRPRPGRRRRARHRRHRGAADKLTGLAGARVAGIAVLVELTFLGGRGRLEPALAGAPLEALLTV